jgi:hypothetical protein
MMSKSDYDAPGTLDFVLEAREMGKFLKAINFWWLAPKRWVLKRAEVRGRIAFFAMWNGTNHRVDLDNARISWQKNQNGHRVLFIKNLANGRKFRIGEFADMFPNGKEDFTALMQALGAGESWISKLAKLVVPSPLERVIDGLKD